MILRCIITLSICCLLTACAGGRPAAVGPHPEVFRLAEAGTVPGSGQAVVTITASIKSHKDSSLLFETARHGSSDYPLLIEIDGQSFSLPVRIMEENTPSAPLSDPEGGAGLRYSYNATLLLEPGVHTLTARMPTEHVETSRELKIRAGSGNIMIRPLYRSSAGRKPASLRWVPNYMDGVGGLSIVVE